MRKLVPLLAFVVLSIPALPAAAQAQPPAAKALDVEAQEPSVVLLSLGEIRNQKLIPTPNFARTQKEIALAALEFTDVVVFIDLDLDFVSVRDAFSRYHPALGRAVKEGRLRFFVVPHDTYWVRDYGPQIKTGAKDFVLVDSKYQDIRYQTAIERQRKAVNEDRKKLIETVRLELTKSGAGLSTGTLPQTRPDARLEHIKDWLNILKHQDEILASGKLNDRSDDDFSPYEMMQAVTDRAAIQVERPDLYLEGGNLLRLADGHLITTKELILRNRKKENGFTDQMKKYFAVQEVVYLDALPGPVIRHVDMFLLPATGKRVLLASYDPSQFSPSPRIRVLTELAAQAMKKNKARLEKLGYEVIEVPSLPPVETSLYGMQLAPTTMIYYPTLLNALTLRTDKGGFAVLVPYYPFLDQYAQFAAYKKIRQAFGGDVRIIPVDCSITALSRAPSTV